MINKTPTDYKHAIQLSGATIYTPVEVGDSECWIPTPHLESLLNDGMRGLSLAKLPLRTRSKVVKAAVCAALGYPTPTSFVKTQPRFPGQQLDTYVQKAMNLQIWNEELAPARRYAIIQVSPDDVILKVKVITGRQLENLDTTGTITRKYQASFSPEHQTHELISVLDTPQLLPFVRSDASFSITTSPTEDPKFGELLPIAEIFRRLSPLVGEYFSDPGADQERNRGAALHRLICEALGYQQYEDNGQFPDIRHQLLEVKLQTSRTIDLGLILPTSDERLDINTLENYAPRHCDTRYAVFYAVSDEGNVTLKNLFTTTGADFFSRFRRFEGKITNTKIQIRLPQNFFNS